MPPEINEFFEWLTNFSSSPWFYWIVIVMAMLDAVLPIVPSETIVIIGGVAAASSTADGSLNIVLVIACGAIGAFIGDNVSYAIGARASGFITRRFTRTDIGRWKYESVVRQIRERGGVLLVTARFIPGARTILTMTCGITRQPRSWFVPWSITATTIWATYASMLGFFGGRTFHDNATLAFGVAFGTAVSVTIVIEAIRWVLRRRVGT